MFNLFQITTEKELFNLLLYSFLLSSPVIAGALFIVGSPYGSQTSYSGRLALNGCLAWIIMELVSPAALLLAYTYPLAPGQFSQRTHTTDLFVILWVTHYINRALIYPLRQPSRKPMHVGIMLSACLFNLINGYLNGRWLSIFSLPPTTTNINSHALLKTILGVCLFLCGMLGNIYHDEILMRIRRNSQNTRYAVPFGGGFALVSCPHFLCELVEWMGFAVATGSPAAWAFVLSVMCNLVPRAMFIHRWYQDKFDNYPNNRKAIIPFLV